ncbi:hypothetical protein T09_8702 [Trichinella sp. T9]|nr:hypothetical protein T09_8702 [Trichinella sp. T9]
MDIALMLAIFNITSHYVTSRLHALTYIDSGGVVLLGLFSILYFDDCDSIIQSQYINLFRFTAEIYQRKWRKENSDESIVCKSREYTLKKVKTPTYHANVLCTVFFYYHFVRGVIFPLKVKQFCTFVNKCALCVKEALL